MARIAKCPNCGFNLSSVGICPSQLKIKQAAEGAAARRIKREIEAELRRWYAGDFELIYSTVKRIKVGQGSPEKKMSDALYQSVLNANANKLKALEQTILDETETRFRMKISQL